jgi:rod shape-determining protein MreC
MSYQFRSSREDRRNSKKLFGRLFVGVGLLFVCLLALWLFPHTLSGMAHGVGGPFWKFKRGVVYTSGVVVKFFGSKISLSKENIWLKEQLAQKEAQIAASDLIKQENTLLKESMGRRIDGNLVLATVLTRPPQSPYDTIVLDVGENDGISKDDLVFAGDVLIGKISELFGNSSQVLLFSSAGQKFEVLVGVNSTSAEAEGRGGGNFIIKIPRGVEIKEGDSIIAPSISSYVFGKISKIELAPNDSFQSVYFDRGINLNELRFVEVLHK